MHIAPANLRMSLGGYSRLPPPPLVAVELSRSELHLLALAVEHEADMAREERRDQAAERLDRRACDLREAGR